MQRQIHFLLRVLEARRLVGLLTCSPNRIRKLKGKAKGKERCHIYVYNAKRTILMEFLSSLLHLFDLRIVAIMTAFCIQFWREIRLRVPFLLSCGLGFVLTFFSEKRWLFFPKKIAKRKRKKSSHQQRLLDDDTEQTLMRTVDLKRKQLNWNPAIAEEKTKEIRTAESR